MRTALLLATLAIAASAEAQFTLQISNTTADLRGIHNVGNGVAWASGTHGTVLRTEDGGYVWQTCSIPPGAESLDFRGVQAFDANTAIVMSSGPGDQSRLYKTTDGCHTWRLLAKDPDPEGFWDSFRTGDGNDPLRKEDERERSLILGDSVKGELRLWEWKEGWEERELELSYDMKGKSQPEEGSFAASNSVLDIVRTTQVDPIWKFAVRFASGTANRSYFSILRIEHTDRCEPCREEILRVKTPMAQNSKSAGIFSFDFRTELIGVAVGGDYRKPAADRRTAAITSDGGLSWKLAKTPPHGYRSSVAYEPSIKTWITVGPNGTDISTDDGRNWHPVHPDPALRQPEDADRNWNALSLPYVVGPKGRIGRLDPAALNLATRHE